MGKQPDQSLADISTVSLKREPACFAYLSTDAVLSPRAIDEIRLDLASADYVQGRASVWITLDAISSGYAEKRVQLLGFDHLFFEAFVRGLLLTATTSRNHTIESNTAGEHHVFDYITRRSSRKENPVTLIEMHFCPYSTNVLISGVYSDKAGDDSLFQLPRTDSFLRAFSKMAHEAKNLFERTIERMERLGELTTPQGLIGSIPTTSK